MKKLVVFVFVILFINALLADFPYGCLGSVRVRLHFQDNTSIEGFTTIHGFDLPNFKVFDIDKDDEFYKLPQGTDIMPYLSKKIQRRYFAEEIFYIPEKLSVVSEDKITIHIPPKFLSRKISKRM